MIKRFLKWRSERPQRLFNNPLKIMRQDLIECAIFQLFCIFLHIWGIEEKSHLVGAFFLGFPFAENLTLLADRWKTRKHIKFIKYFDIAVVTVFLLLLASITGYAFSRNWYVYSITISIIINFVLIYMIYRNILLHK